MSSEWFIGFVDGTSCHTCNLTSAALVIYSPSWQRVASGGAYLGPTTNNVSKYIPFIDLLWDATLHGITHLEVILDSQLMVSHINSDYQVWNLNLLR